MGAAYWAILVVAVLLASLLTYSAVSTLKPAPSSAAPQQALINELQSQNAELQRELTAQGPPSNATLIGLNPIQIYQEASASVVTVQGVEGSGFSNSTVLGSGFATDLSGAHYIVTNFHVVRGVTALTVTFQDGDAYPATVVGSDGYSDLAVLNVSSPSSEFHPLQIVSSSRLVVGQPVVAIGNPFGLSGSMTFGIVSQLGRTISESLAGNFAIANVVQFSAPINPGNSGGPLFDADGAVVGITTAVVASSQGVGFAIPSDTILRELPFLVTTGGYTLHPFMGISSVDMNYQLAQLQNTNVTYGVLIQNLTQGGPADKAGLRAGPRTQEVQGVSYAIGGDIVISVNGTKIVNTDALSSYLAEYATAGQTVVLQIIRGGHLMTVDLVLGTRPPAPSA
ncbi:MAG TPA: trypsin-like peptidase domain-containing protein [Nitrososphaerales archaeon]|nr:trypsin-like peptidase domain-containing protein [Nitrososphaerales archaeon]